SSAERSRRSSTPSTDPSLPRPAGPPGTGGPRPSRHHRGSPPIFPRRRAAAFPCEVRSGRSRPRAGCPPCVACRRPVGGGPGCRPPVGGLSAAGDSVGGMKRIDNDPGGASGAVTVRGLVKHYGATKALDGVDLDVREGTVMGVLGPNGAGKTTLVRILSTLLAPTSGRATVAGYDVVRRPRQLRRVIGLTGQYASA